MAPSAGPLLGLRVVTLPAACELLRADFDAGGAGADDASTDVLKTVLRFVSKARWRQLSALLLPDAPPLTVRFRAPATACHETLSLVRAPARRPSPKPPPAAAPEPPTG